MNVDAKEVPTVIIDQLKRQFTGFPVPDGIFDPASAKPDLLRKYGLPPRPDPNCQPLLRKAWERGFGKPMTLQQFNLNVDRVQATVYSPHPREQEAVLPSATRFETSSNWSGCYITSNNFKRLIQVWGLWKVPGNLKLPPPTFQGPQGVPYICANWIGLDGQRLYLDSSLPQIGTSSTLQTNGMTVTESWAQWWARFDQNTVPAPLGLSVNPGDEVLCVLTVWDPQTVNLVMVNLSSPNQPNGMAVKGTAPTMTLPNNVQYVPSITGATAQWIVERPRVVGSTELNNFPDYGQTEFDSCIAVEGDEADIFALFGGVSQELQGTRRIRMIYDLFDPARTAFVSMPRKVNETTSTVRYGGFT